MQSGIYKIGNLQNGKLYIGSAAKKRVVKNPHVYTDEEKEHAAKICKERFSGLKLTKEHREKLRLAKLGRKLTDEVKAKMSKSHLLFRAKQRGDI